MKFDLFEAMSIIKESKLNSNSTLGIFRTNTGFKVKIFTFTSRNETMLQEQFCVSYDMCRNNMRNYIQFHKAIQRLERTLRQEEVKETDEYLESLVEVDNKETSDE